MCDDRGDIKCPFVYFVLNTFYLRLSIFIPDKDCVCTDVAKCIPDDFVDFERQFTNIFLFAASFMTLSLSIPLFDKYLLYAYQ